MWSAIAFKSQLTCKVKFNDAYLAVSTFYCPHSKPLDVDGLNTLVATVSDFNALQHQWVILGQIVEKNKQQTVFNYNLTLLNDGSGTRVNSQTDNISAIDLSWSSSDIASSPWHL